MYRLQGRCPYRPGARIHFFSRTFFVPYIFFSVHFLFRTFLNTAYTHIAWCPHCFFFCCTIFKTADGPGCHGARCHVFFTHKRTTRCVFYTQTHDALCFLHTQTQTEHKGQEGTQAYTHTHIHACYPGAFLISFFSFPFSIFLFFIFYFEGALLFMKSFFIFL